MNSQRANLAAAQQQLKQQEENFKNVAATYKRNQELFEKGLFPQLKWIRVLLSTFRLLRPFRHKERL
ncbi:hypothetical protein [Sphingobacterium sp. E70]|uniref:hypothetical protein n=1 Tax=Sphingobacterium sp. E70 TaxID=2853439 RepID=UPI0027961EAF|nr:hypothetical protein [Sphingobacterium sp. E70]